MVADLSTDWLFHDSHQLYYRKPFGAVPCNTDVELRLIIDASRSVEEVLLRLWSDGGGEKTITMTSQMPSDGKRVYRAVFTSPANPGLLWYYFLVKSRGNIYYYGNNLQRTGGVGEISRIPPSSYQITVHKKDVKTPDWFKNTVVYQIFVDRFYNGNEDGKIMNLKPGSLIHASWENNPIYIRERVDGGILAYDFFGGNLKGIIAKLPYLKELGIGVVYMNPIFEAPSNHKYDTADYKNIDPMFGTNEIFRNLCEQGKKQGMAVILDGVFSHTGSDSVYFNREGHYPEVGAYQSPDSPYYSWYRFSKYPDEYESWWGVSTLPNVEEMDASYRDFILHSKNSVIRHWQHLGAKGWRLDVADELPDQFLKELNQVVKETDKEAVIIGEVWEDASNKVSYGVMREYFYGNELDSVTNYLFRRQAIDFLLGYREARAILEEQMSICENYPKENFFATLNVLGSHDVPRILTLLGGHEPRPDGRYGEEMKRKLDTEERILAINRLKVASLWQMTFPGVPCVYYGDEVGLEGYTDPLNRRPYPWGREESELIAWYKKIIGLRNRHAILRTGYWQPFAPQPNVYGYVRYLNKGRDAFGNDQEENVAVILLNRSLSSAEATVDLKTWCQGMLFDALNYGQEVAVGGGRATISLRPLEAKLLLYKLDDPPKKCGTLLHISSLPSGDGIGSLGEDARKFVDFLASAGQRYWQILPLNPVGPGNSPYQSVSALACEPLFIDIGLLAAGGLLEETEINAAREKHNIQSKSDKVDYPGVKVYKDALLRKAFSRFSKATSQSFDDFINDNKSWVNDYALYMALVEHFGDFSWNKWPKAVAERDPQALNSYRELLANEINYHTFTQYIFHQQWFALKSYANNKGIKIIGDLPIFVAYESSDVWANRMLFKLDEANNPTTVAGVPPDYFSKTGQLWGNPLYDWDKMASDDFVWWRQRFSALFKLVDMVRVDHFRGFEAAWEVPYGEETAENGEWVKGPGETLFAVLEKYLGKLPVIAEDLGVITPEVEELRRKSGFPGMKVLHFLFNCNYHGQPEPLWCLPDTVVYTGTHDNNTTRGWYEDNVKKGEAGCLGNYLGEHLHETDIAWRLVELAYRCRSQLAIIPVQDFLGLGTSARMNVPGTPEGNWGWRLTSDSIPPGLADKIRALAIKYGRIES